MPIHLLKTAVGVTDPDHLRQRQAQRLATVAGRTVVLGYTRRKPRLEPELLAGGSIYWIIKGVIPVRQPLLGFADAVDGEGLPYCQIHLDPGLVATVPMPRRAIQGWRYLAPDDAPADRGPGGGGDDLPPELVRELRALGLL